MQCFFFTQSKKQEFLEVGGFFQSLVRLQPVIVGEIAKTLTQHKTVKNDSFSKLNMQTNSFSMNQMMVTVALEKIPFL